MDPTKDPLDIDDSMRRIKVLEGLLRQWLIYRKHEPDLRRQLRLHTRRVLDIQTPIQPENRRDSAEERKKRLNM